VGDYVCLPGNKPSSRATHRVDVVATFARLEDVVIGVARVAAESHDRLFPVELRLIPSFTLEHWPMTGRLDEIQNRLFASFVHLIW
jgi:hypothetical protein